MDGWRWGNDGKKCLNGIGMRGTGRRKAMSGRISTAENISGKKSHIGSLGCPVPGNQSSND
eukprot:CAMPEP_0197441558 /NCGR_PEP_ID=MMETSP1175-20131217/7801_1 /TAXON_ID=1003142 /ORGANISM="Triceratium dubium, Strain CCMP147" /LENGTH=60 /DNA_ID=CAMNT_0042971855 /DNA_START=1459 /DNA_END=1641 /DNA_ORIENTATION=-